MLSRTDLDREIQRGWRYDHGAYTRGWHCGKGIWSSDPASGWKCEDSRVINHEVNGTIAAVCVSTKWSASKYWQAWQRASWSVLDFQCISLPEPDTVDCTCCLSRRKLDFMLRGYGVWSFFPGRSNAQIVMSCRDPWLFPRHTRWTLRRLNADQERRIFVCWAPFPTSTVLETILSSLAVPGPSRLSAVRA